MNSDATHRRAPSPRYDLFLSLSGDDRHAAGRLYTALCDAGLRVFLDERDIRDFHSINSEIQLALVNSTALLAYYSASYATRPACQLELTAAFLTGLRDGDPTRRILVVNPEPGTDHLLPTELADAKFPTFTAARGPAALVRAIVARVAELDGTFGELSFAERPPWYGARSPGMPPGFIGRYREQWELHSALVDCDHPMTREPTSGAQVVLAGLSGSGRTSLVAAYAWQFGAAHPGGVHWLSLAGVEGDARQVLARYSEEVRHLAEQLRLPVAGLDRGRLFEAVGDHLAARACPSLWVVDDVPPGLDADTIRKLFAPVGHMARTVLVTRRAEHSADFSTVALGSMSAVDAGAVLSTWRKVPDGAPEVARAHARLVDRIGGHPRTLVLAGLRLRTIDYASLLDQVGADPTFADHLVGDAVDGLDRVQALILRIAEKLASGPVPAELLCRAVQILHPVEDGHPAGPELCADAFVELEARLLAVQTRAGEWQFPRVGVLAYSHRGPEPEGVHRLLAARTLELLHGGVLDTTARRHLIGHAEALLSDGEAEALDDTIRTGLLLAAAAHHETRGEPLLAAPHREALVRQDPGNASHLLAAARNRHLAGEPEAALGHLDRLLAAGLETETGSALLLRAEVRETLGRLDAAEEDWASLLSDAPVPSQVRLARVRSLSARDDNVRARALVNELLATQHHDGGLASDDLQAVRVELARCQRRAHDQRGARATARSVVEYYAGTGLPEHRTAVEAREVLADSLLALELWDLKPDEGDWVEGEVLLRGTWRGFVDSHGPLNPLTLRIAVQHGYALVCLGRAEQARMELTRTDADVAGRLGDTHPLRLRSRFLLGQASAQLEDWLNACDLFAFVTTWQRATLGPEHVHTLISQVEYAVALQMTSREEEAAPLFDEVMRTSRRVLGWNNDVFGKALAGRLLRYVPGRAWRLITRKP
ncbi:TIR domain-containing protein [Longispora sp. NPDC051575]|uniref:tetratricopeptide repeat protein n=1 Tax=Longispora sp. NPDC051575 TaxID=3154943 RepID=UPI00343A5E03